MTATEAAIALKVEADYVLRLLRVGKLKGRKVGNRWVVDARSVQRRLARINGNEEVAQ
jgi:excisionase family DNA binding protein